MHPHRSSALDGADSDTQTRCGSATVMVLVSEASGPRVRGCPRAPRYFHPNPVRLRRIYPTQGCNIPHVGQLQRQKREARGRATLNIRLLVA